MLPTYYPSEMIERRDPLTGRGLRQLTADARSVNVHFYFTENSFVRGENAILFLSDRDTQPTLNVFRLALDTGEITRLTHHRPPEHTGSFTKDPTGEHVLYTRGSDVMLLRPRAGELRVLFTLAQGWRPGRVTLNADGTLVGVLTNEDVHVEHGLNYAGFEEKMYRCKKCRFWLIPLEGGPPRLIARDTHECGHFQFSPVNPHLAMYCHEGPWHLVHQRMWLLDVRTGEVEPCFRQGAQDSVGHEFWTRRGQVFFDNRGPGHDGTITSSRTQAVARAVETDFVPYVGLAGERGEVLRTNELSHYCNHYHATGDDRMLVGDEVENLVLIALNEEGSSVISPLCHHGTSWYGQHTHCHPTFSWDDRQVLFASDETGTVQLYLIDVPARDSDD